MKIRNGFVSNSSSSSFVVGFPKGLSKSEKKKILFDKMGVDKNSFFIIAAEEISKCILDSEHVKGEKGMLEYYGYDTMESFAEDYEWEYNTIKKALDKGFDLYLGSATNEGYEIGEALFCEMGWHVDDDDFVISKEESF